MKKEIFFTILGIICFFSFSIGLTLAFFSIRSNNAFAIGLIFPTGVGLCLLTMLILKYMIDLPLTVENLEKRDIEKEKEILGKLVIWGNVFYLFSISVLLFLVVTILSKFQPDLEIYMVVIASACIGGLWALGIHETLSFRSWYTYGRDFDKSFDWTDKSNAEWYTWKGSFLGNLRYWKKRFVYSFSFFIVIMSVIYILFYENII